MADELDRERSSLSPVNLKNPKPLSTFNAELPELTVISLRLRVILKNFQTLLKGNFSN